MKFEVYVPDTLWHRFKRELPSANLDAFIRQAMQEAIDSHAKEVADRAFFKRIRNER